MIGDAETKRQIDDLLQGRTHAAASFALATWAATTTTVNRTVGLLMGVMAITG
jgi:hypothetical protein